MRLNIDVASRGEKLVEGKPTRHKDRWWCLGLLPEKTIRHRIEGGAVEQNRTQQQVDHCRWPAGMGKSVLLQINHFLEKPNADGRLARFHRNQNQLLFYEIPRRDTTLHSSAPDLSNGRLIGKDRRSVR